MAYWLMKSEPDAYSIDQFKAEKKCLWDGIRNYQARNFMMKDMKVGDEFLFYHSNAKPPGVVGLGVINKPAVPDPSQFDKKSKYFDAKSQKDNPRWHCIEAKLKKKFKNMVSLNELKEEKALKDMVLLNNSRLSIQPVTEKEFKHILNLLGE